MVAKVYTRGHETYYDEKTGEWKYCDDNSSANIERPCAKCKHMPYKGGEDYCLGPLGSRDIVAACCGHGIDGQGYIMLKDGRIFRLEERSDKNDDERLQDNKKKFDKDKLYDCIEIIIMGSNLYSKSGIMALNELKAVMDEWEYVNVDCLENGDDINEKTDDL